MKIENVHQRQVAGDEQVARALLDAVGTRRDRLWPRDDWPAMILDKPAAEGGRGGHGPVRYHATQFESGQRIVYTFEDAGLSKGLVGTHRLELSTMAGSCTLRHVIDVQLRGRALVLWPLVIRPLHDALIEDALDKFATALGSPPQHPARYSAWVRVLRRLLGLRQRRRTGAAAKGGRSNAA